MEDEPTDQDLRRLIRSITPRQKQVLQLLAFGTPNEEIAQRMNLKHSTVKNYVCDLYDATNTHNRTRLALFARDLTQAGYL